MSLLPAIHANDEGEGATPPSDLSGGRVTPTIEQKCLPLDQPLRDTSGVGAELEDEVTDPDVEQIPDEPLSWDVSPYADDL